jgi:cell shape-determining protein MreD
MRQAGLFFLVYLLFLGQAAIGEGAPDLAFVVVVVIALHELPVVAVLLAGFLGISFDSLAVEAVGLHTAAFALIAHAVASVRRYIYRVAWATPLIVILALGVRWAIRLLSSPALPAPLDATVSIALSLAFIPLADWFVARVVFAGWNPD